MILCVVFLLILSACSASAPPQPVEDERFFLSEAVAAQMSVDELMRRYVADEDPAALYLSSHHCPAETTRADSLVTALLALPSTHERTRDYALYWSRILPLCRDPRISRWFRAAIATPRDDLTLQLLTKALLRAPDPVNIEVVKRAAFDTLNHGEARSAILNLFVEELNFSGQERLDLMVESYRKTGEIPGNFAADQASLMWLQHAAKWREALLELLVAAPGKRGAPPLLLTLARETRKSEPGSRWRAEFERALEMLGQNADASPDLISMIPIAREVAQGTR